MMKMFGKKPIKTPEQVAGFKEEKKNMFLYQSMERKKNLRLQC